LPYVKTAEKVNFVKLKYKNRMNIRKWCSVCIIALLLVACKSVEKAGGKAGYGSPQVKQELVDDQMFLIKEYAADKKYGYTVKSPIMVGGGTTEGPKNERRFLNALEGPNGEKVYHQRLGSCCSFYTKNGSYRNIGLLDKYEVTYEGLETPIILYINMYDSDVLKVPVGFTLKK
jgi:hypothetical protein